MMMSPNDSEATPTQTGSPGSAAAHPSQPSPTAPGGGSSTPAVANADARDASAPPATDARAAKATKTTKKDTRPPPTLTGKLKQLQPTVASQHVKLQHIMVKSAETMLGYEEKMLQKSDGLRRYGTTYFDKNDQNSDGRATEKLFVPSSLRLTPLLNASKLVRENEAVADIYRAIETELDAGNKTLMDEFKNKLSLHAKKIAEHEIKARKRLQAIEYFNIAVEFAGSRAIAAKTEGGFDDFKSDIEDVAYAAMNAAILLLPEDHLEHLSFLEPSNFDEPPEVLWKNFQLAHKIKYDPDVKARLKKDDASLIEHVSKEVAVMLPALTTDLWASTAKTKKGATLDAELELFLGRKAVDNANDDLGKAMDIDDDPIDSVVETAVDKRIKKHFSKSKSEMRKNYSGDAATKASTPKGNGRSGSNPLKGKQQNSRGRSKKRYPTRDYVDEESYDSRESSRSRSRPRKQGDEKLPRSIMKKGVRWHRSVSTDDQRGKKERKPRGGEKRDNHKHQGRGRGGRGGRGGSRYGGRGRGGKER